MKIKLKDMEINGHTVGGIYEISFGYCSDLWGYTTLMSDIMKSSDHCGQKKEG